MNKLTHHNLIMATFIIFSNFVEKILVESQDKKKKEYVFKRNKCPRENLGGRNHKLPFIF